MSVRAVAVGRWLSGEGSCSTHKDSTRSVDIKTGFFFPPLQMGFAVKHDSRSKGAQSDFHLLTRPLSSRQKVQI